VLPLIFLGSKIFQVKVIDSLVVFSVARAENKAAFDRRGGDQGIRHSHSRVQSVFFHVNCGPVSDILV
jgi:hypothetical protein